MNETKAKINVFLAQFVDSHDFQDDEDIFAAGFVNSMFAMQLVLFVEQEFQLVVKDEDLDLENFRTINAITAFVERKTALLIRD